MTRRICSRLGILALVATLFSPPLLRAQSQGCADSASPSSVPVQKTKIDIVGVEFQGENPLSGELRAQLAKDIQNQERWVGPEEPDLSWVAEALSPVRDALQEQGYFRTNVEGTPYLVLAQAKERRYVLTVQIESGPRFKLGTIRFASASDTPLVFIEALLRQQIPLQESEPFDVSKIRGGLEAIGRLYGSKGYIDATPEPDTTIDEESSRIDVLIRVDQERRYTIANIAFLGLDTGAQNKLKVPQENGEPLNFALWKDFFEEDKSHLPPHASPDKNMRVRRDVSNATVDITIDFRPCPKTQPNN